MGDGGSFLRACSDGDSQAHRRASHRKFYGGSTTMSMESISALAELTGKDRRTISRLIRAARLKPVIKGKAHLYESQAVLPLIYDCEPRPRRKSYDR